MGVRRCCQLLSLGLWDHINMLIPGQGHGLTWRRQDESRDSVTISASHLTISASTRCKKVLVPCFTGMDLSPGGWQSQPLSPAPLDQMPTQQVLKLTIASNHCSFSRESVGREAFPLAVQSVPSSPSTGHDPEAWRDAATCPRLPATLLGLQTHVQTYFPLLTILLQRNKN